MNGVRRWFEEAGESRGANSVDFSRCCQQPLHCLIPWHPLLVLGVRNGTLLLLLTLQLPQHENSGAADAAQPNYWSISGMAGLGSVVGAPKSSRFRIWIWFVKAGTNKRTACRGTRSKGGRQSMGQDKRSSNGEVTNAVARLIERQVPLLSNTNT